MKIYIYQNGNFIEKLTTISVGIILYNYHNLRANFENTTFEIPFF